MQQLIVNVPDDKVAFFKELIHSLGFAESDLTMHNLLSAEQELKVKNTLTEMKEKPEQQSNWEEVLHRLDPEAC